MVNVRSPHRRSIHEQTYGMRGRGGINAGILTLAMLTLAGAHPAFAQPATYHVKLLSLTPPKLAVSATTPIDGRQLVMDTTRPAGIPELDAGGWPAIITGLRVTDSAGKPIGVTAAGAEGWHLDQAQTGRLTLDYEVDYSALASHGWPAPRESGMADAGHLILAARSIFITTRQVGAGVVTFDLPAGWSPVTPWGPSPGSPRAYSVRSSKELVENLVALTRSAPDEVTAGGFRLLVVPIGYWQPARDEVRRVLHAVVPRLVALMQFDDRENYLVVLLPTMERGGESFRNSFAMTVDSPPSRANRLVWGGTLTHEIFHYWNGWRLTGSDYAASQWFQEGFTEYAANVSMLAGKVMEPRDFIQKLSDHVGNYRKLTTSLEAGGSRKGPPLYSGGALVAFSWDVLIRHATGGKRNLGDFFRTLWRQTDRGRHPYEWPDIRAALQSTVPRDWDAFFNTFVRGTGKLPFGEVLPLAGLRLEEVEGAAPRVTEDPSATAASKKLWRSLVAGR